MGISKRVCLFVFNEDYICQNLVSEVLQHCSYEVLHIGRAMDALTEIGKRKHGISVVLTNMNRLKTKGAEIIQAIQEELNLRVCLILPGNMEFDDTRGLDCNVSAFIVNFSDTKDMKELWQSAFEKEKARKAAISSQVVGVETTTSENNEPSLDGEPGNDHYNRKAKELSEEQSEESGSETRKKPRLSWNPEMHQRFVEAVNKLGFDKAVPKKIVEFMNEPGLTREHVASHLQKYRMNLRKGQDSSSNFIYGHQKLTNDVTNPFYCSYPSALNLNSSFPFERNNNSVFSTLLGQSSLLNPNISTTLTQQPHMFPTNNLLGALNHIFPPQLSFDAKRVMNQNGEVGHSSGSSSVSMNQQQPTSFLGLRVVNNVLQFGESCGETHRESSSLFTADWTYSSGNNNADSVPFLETSTDQSVNHSETVSPAGTFIPQHQQASFPAAFGSSPYTEINTNDDPASIVSLLPLLGNSENLSSKQIESSSSLSVPPEVIEINSYGGEEDISALLDAADNDTPNNNPEEGLWDDDDFSDILSGFTK
ncbi:two-component response regulator ORR21-like [Ipomoea triloba]|uniref:two-component response regulator ORR21-like n=1 Tax=Ipomoea triloba TaxID=35885 RepID=UPI00125DDAE6|nr:two-component response regulator ORR21-like [Ipomoea triloba]